MVKATFIQAPMAESSIFDMIVDPTELTAPIVNAFGSLEAWLSPNTKSNSNPSYTIAGPDQSGNYEGRLIDTSNRYTYGGLGGTTLNYVGYYNGSGGGQDYIPTLTDFNDIPALGISRAGDGLRLPAERGRIVDPASAIRPFLTDEYTFFLVGAFPSTGIGAILNVGAASAAYNNDDLNAGCGFRVGFPDENNNGKLLYQHSPYDADRIMPTRTIGNNTRTAFVGRGKADYTGKFSVLSQNNLTHHPFAFTRSRFNLNYAQPAPLLGASGPGDGTRPGYARKITHMVVFSKYFSDEQVVNYLADLAKTEHGGSFA